MTDDHALSRELTALIRATTGVAAVYPAQPIVEAAVDAVAVKLALRQPDVLVDVDRDGDALRIAAGIAVDDARPATDTVREVGERIRAVTDERADVRPDLISVSVRLVDDLGDGHALA